MAMLSATVEGMDESAGAPPSAPKPEEEAGLAETPPVKRALCGVCNENPPKYKCPRCYLP